MKEEQKKDKGVVEGRGKEQNKEEEGQEEEEEGQEEEEEEKHEEEEEDTEYNHFLGKQKCEISLFTFITKKGNLHLVKSLNNLKFSEAFGSLQTLYPFQLLR